MVILQHTKESRISINTARIVHRVLRNSQLWIESDFAHHTRLETLVANTPREQLGLLFPGPDAQELRPEQPLTHLLIPDGTWSQARALLRDSPILQSLPRYQFTPTSASRYRIRKEPSVECVSTLEAVVRCLEDLGESPTLGVHLLELFDRMVEDQLRFVQPPKYPRTAKPE
jgi:DTW domain-containing protein YfiP